MVRSSRASFPARSAGSDLLSSVTLGSAAALEPQHKEDNAIPPIVIGHDLAETIDAKVGTAILVTSPQGALTPFGMLPKYQYFRVVGIFHSGLLDQYDSSMAFTSLRGRAAAFWRAGRGIGDFFQGG